MAKPYKDNQTKIGVTELSIFLTLLFKPLEEVSEKVITEFTEKNKDIIEEQE